MRSTEIEMAEREYKDSEGNVVTLDKLVRIEPEWAANIIRWYESKLDETQKQLISRNAEMAEANVRISKLLASTYSLGEEVNLLEGDREELQYTLETYQTALAQIAAFIEQQRQSVENRVVERHVTNEETQ